MSKFFDRFENQQTGTNAGTRKEAAPGALVKSSFESKYVEHQMEFVARINGVDYINNSAATGLETVWNSLVAARRPTVWIAGAIDTNADYNMLTEVVTDKVKAIVSVGKQRNFKLWQAYSRHTRHLVDAENLEEAVHFAFSLAEADDQVLFSPGCGSYGEYESYRERGRDFKLSVTEIYKALLRR